MCGSQTGTTILVVTLPPMRKINIVPPLDARYDEGEVVVGLW
jgi:hypothetical protein